MKCRADELAILGAPMDEDDLIDKILDGLGDDYKELVHAVQARDTMIMFDELYEKLFNFEASLQGAKSEPSHFPTTANPANRWRPLSNASNRSPVFPNTGQNSFRSQRPSSRPYLSYCQIYGIQGHTAKRCPSFCLVPNRPHTTPVAPMNNNTTTWQPQAHFASNTTSNTPQ
uniref:Uncharacterized protein n=1 Tax=Populus alba TaxID=43335 RepID=A0A4U5QIZ2_POPAL|nr:hypothetical protein D5086_0000081560 [Populus alba]